MHIIFDWDGTIAKPDVARKAGMLRYKMLGVAENEERLKQHMKTDGHFDILRMHISELTGITDKRYLTAMMTDVFRICYHAAVHEMKEEVFYDGMKEVITKLAENNTLSIATTLRQDLIDYSLELLGVESLFKGVYGNNPELDFSKEDLIKQAMKEHGSDAWMIGDKMDDVESGRNQNLKTAFVEWGAGELVDFEPEILAKTPEDLLQVDN